MVQSRPETQTHDVTANITKETLSCAWYRPIQKCERKASRLRTNYRGTRVRSAEAYEECE